MRSHSETMSMFNLGPPTHVCLFQLPHGPLSVAVKAKLAAKLRFNSEQHPAMDC